MSAKVLLITGATGKQGTALISALQHDTTEPRPFRILGLTRNVTSPAAEQLALSRDIEIVQGDLDDADSLRKIFEDAKEIGGVWGVFSVLAFPGLGANADGEEKQGKTLADLALEYGVSTFLYSSFERGSEGYDDQWTPSKLSKVKIERYIRELGTKGLNWTILRPGFFMENLEGTIGRVTVGVLATGLKSDTAIRLVAVQDIGHIAAGVFKEPERHTSKVLVLVGDILTVHQLRDEYKKATGRTMPSIPAFVARVIIRFNRHTQTLIREMERDHLLRIDPQNEENKRQMASAHEVYPNMTTFGAWAIQRQETGSATKKGWNQVTIGRLLTGKL